MFHVAHNSSRCLPIAQRNCACSLSTTRSQPSAWHARAVRVQRRSSPVVSVSATAESPQPQTQSTAASIASVEAAVATLKRAAGDKSVPGRDVFQAMRALEKAKLSGEGWEDILANNRGWRLVFTSSSKDIAKDTKGTGVGSGLYFPIAASQRWNKDARSIRNGVYLSHLAALEFSGKMVMSKNKRMAFDFDSLRLKVGPWAHTFKLKDAPEIEKLGRDQKAPFFLFSYVDDNIIVARGRGGGVAYWARCTSDWELANGIV